MVLRRIVYGVYRIKAVNVIIVNNRYTDKAVIFYCPVVLTDLMFYDKLRTSAYAAFPF